MVDSYGLGSLSCYRDMAFGHTNSLGPVGRSAFAWIFAGPLLALACCFVPNYGPRRDPNETYGNDSKLAAEASTDTESEP